MEVLTDIYNWKLYIVECIIKIQLSLAFNSGTTFSFKNKSSETSKCSIEKTYIKLTTASPDIYINLSGYRYLLIHLSQNIVLKIHSWLQIQSFTRPHTCRQPSEIYKFNFSCNRKLIIKLTSCIHSYWIHPLKMLPFSPLPKHPIVI